MEKEEPLPLWLLRAKPSMHRLIALDQEATIATRLLQPLSLSLSSLPDYNDPDLDYENISGLLRQLASQLQKRSIHIHNHSGWDW